MQYQATTLLIAVVLTCTANYVPGTHFQIATSHPSFVTLMPNGTTWNLLISRFNGFPFSKDYISIVRDIGSSEQEKHVEDISSSLHWPNEPGNIPERVFNRKSMIIIPSGFLVPTKGDGALTIYDLNDEEPYTGYTVTSDSEGEWFYHRAIWLDMDGDGRDDIVTCRAQKPIFGDESGEMLWFKQPAGEEPWKGTWKETILQKGSNSPDTFLIPVELTEGGATVQTIMTAGFFSKSLDIWWRKDEQKQWTSDNMNKRVIDDTEGATFDLLYADLNNDNIKDLLVTYNKPANGTVFVYEFAGDPRSSKIEKNLIFSGLDPAKSGVGKGAPGGVKLAWPNTSNKTARPDIILSGDDNGRLYLLRSLPAANWTYSNFVLLDSSPGTLGAVAVGDIDNDNFTEIIAPSYDDGIVSILTYNPSKINQHGKHTHHSRNFLQKLIDWLKSIF